MLDDLDHYEASYADKLGNLIPAVYRAEDTDQFDAKGPLRELVNRIGVRAAILRRGIDRLWEDQSIETCDDWVIPYIADLLATNLVNSLDSHGQRIDVAKTIYFRRRKGTLAIRRDRGKNHRLGRARRGVFPAAWAHAAKLGPGHRISSRDFHEDRTNVSARRRLDDRLQLHADLGAGRARHGTGFPRRETDRRRKRERGDLRQRARHQYGKLRDRRRDPDVHGAPAARVTVAIIYEYPVGGNRSAQLAEGLVGALTNSFIGGWADLRNVYGAALADAELAATGPLAQSMAVPMSRWAASLISGDVPFTERFPAPIRSAGSEE